MKKNKKETKNVIEQVFNIPQIPKIEGIRGANKYVKEKFISSLFGSDVKDEIHVPFVVHVIGDKVKQYDAFRTKPQMTDEVATKNHGSKYYEFDNVINKETRKQLFGVDSYEKNQQKKPEEKHEQEEPVWTKPAPVVEEIKNLPPWMKGRSVASTSFDDEGLQKSMLSYF